MSTYSTSIGDLTDVIEKGLNASLKTLIKTKLQESVNDLLEEMAIQIANNIVINAESLNTHSLDKFSNETRVVVNFNLKQPPMTYDSKTGEVKNRTVLDK